MTTNTTRLLGAAALGLLVAACADMNRTNPTGSSGVAAAPGSNTGTVPATDSTRPMRPRTGAEGGR